MASNEKGARKKIFLLAGAVGVAVVALFVLRSRGVDPRQIGEWLASVGLACIKPREYVTATFIGTVPGIFIPKFVRASEAKFMDEDEPVVGVVIGGVAKAYSTWHLDHHEIVNDSIASQPLAVTW